MVRRLPRVATKKKPIDGRSKGNAFERKISKRLSLWLSKGDSPDLFWRTAASGARSTSRARTTGRGIESAAGDINATSSEAEAFTRLFSIECKTYKSLELEQLFFAQSLEQSIVGRFWLQTKRQAASVQRHPLLIAKQNARGELVLLPTPVYERVLAWGTMGGAKHKKKAPRSVYVETGTIAVLSLDDFLELLDPDDLEPMKRCLPRPRAILLS